ncbi:helix-turn-helix domain-containing protein [Nocardioides sp.]|uniref:PucR family transcriptional regulator n=1 Tax=Nocardioides sp. TaxID=35761 RepID=UPI00261EBFC0|nr:helix-turn-helix domain-containing protein [Nocardioides sp.]MDI6911088.1 helix-turn-helix domain-containing protein [Nocardioides sp.]
MEVHASVGAILDIIGSATVTLASDPAGRDLGISHPVLHDPHDPPLTVTRGLLLAVGVRPGPGLQDLLSTAVERGYNAVAVKAGDRSCTDAAKVADAAGIALMVIEDGLEWLHFERLVATAVEGAGGGASPALSSLAVGDLFSLANAVASATGGATAIEDNQRRVLAYSTLPHQPTDPERRDGILGRQVPDLVDNERQYRELYAAAGAVAFKATDTALGRLACAVRAGTQPVGSIWLVDAGDNLVEDAASLLAGASEIAALHLMRARSAQDVARQRRSDQLRAVLERGDWAAAHHLGLLDGTQMWVLGLDAQDGQSASLDLLRLADVLSIELEARHGRSGCVVLDGRVYAVISGTRVAAAQTPDRIRKVVRAVSGVMGAVLVGGLAGPIVSSSALSAARRDADAVLSLVALRPSLGPVASAEEVRDELTLHSLARRHSPGELSRVAERVLAIDREQGTSHADLLRTWLGCLGDVRETAERMSVHANTVRYRLGRLRELVGLDLDRPDQLVLLWLGLELAERRW